MKRLCLVTQTYLPDVGGSQTYVDSLARSWVENGHQAAIVSGGNGAWSMCEEGPPTELRSGVEVFRIPHLREFCEGSGDIFAASAGLFSVLRRVSPDIIFAQDPLSLLAVSMIASHLDSRVFATLHWTFDGWERRVPRRDWGGGILTPEQASEYERRMVGFCLNHCAYEKLVCVGQQFVEWALALGVTKSKLVHIPNSVDCRRFTPGEPNLGIEQELGLRSGSILVVVPARIIPRKGTLDAIRAFEKVRQLCPHSDLHLLLAGNGHPLHIDYLREVEEAVHSEGLVSAVSTRSVPREMMPALYRRSTAVLLPTRCEGLSTAILEAMACGVPVVTTDIPANREIIAPGVNGLLAAVGDTEGLSLALARVVSDRRLAGIISQNALSLVRNSFDVSHMTDTLLRLFTAGI